jgi:hypothetical protein
MFLLLTQVLLWLALTVIIYNLLLKVIPRTYLTLLGGLFLFTIIVLAFFFPSDPLVSAAWNVLSFPLKPVGATILLLAIALNQGLKNRNQVVAALVILLISRSRIRGSQDYSGSATRWGDCVARAGNHTSELTPPDANSAD